MTDEDWDKELRWSNYTAAMGIASRLPPKTEAALKTLDLAREIVLDLGHYRETGEYRSAAE